MDSLFHFPDFCFQLFPFLLLLSGQAAARGRFADFSALGHRRLPHVLHEPLTTDDGLLKR
jgi:hypothetical protein